jgi:hypothetical protein
MIKPTIGRKVWFWFNPQDQHGSPTPLRIVRYDPKQALDATVVFVHNDRLVNLDVVDHTGEHWPLLAVPLVQKGDQAPVDHGYCEWMPYQQGQAEATKQALSEVEKAKHQSMFADKDVGGK